MKPANWIAGKHIIKVYGGTDGLHQDEFLRGDCPNTLFYGRATNVDFENMKSSVARGFKAKFFVSVINIFPLSAGVYISDMDSAANHSVQQKRRTVYFQCSDIPEFHLDSRYSSSKDEHTNSIDSVFSFV